MAAAQTARSIPTVELVSPGGPDAPTLTTECPTFSWAPGKSVAGYELAVFELASDGQPKAKPNLHVALSGRASAWTPPTTKCLSPGQQYGWYMREFARAGEAPGTWTPALTFSVTGATAVSRAEAAAVSQAGGNGNGGGNPNPSILDRLAAIESQLNTLLAPVKRETCIEFGTELELGPDVEATFKGAADGEAGVWAFGNGIKANLKAAAEVKLAVGLKGAGALKRSICADQLGTIFGLSAQGADARAAAFSDDEFLTRLTTLSQQLQLGDDRLRGMLDALPAFTTGGNAWSPMGSSSPIATLADVLPLPDGLRTTLRNPAQIISNFRNQMSLCSQSDLPPAVASLVSEFCAQASNERFSQLLDRVDGVVQTIKKTTDGTSIVVNTVNNTVNAIKTKVDEFYCKFFCGPN